MQHIKLLFIGLFLSLWAPQVQAQTPAKDSLLRLLQHPATADSTRLSLYQQLVRQTPPDSARQQLHWLLKSYQLAGQLEKTIPHAQLANQLGELYLRRLGQYDSAFYYARQAYEVFRTTNQDALYMRALNTMGLVYSYQRKTQKAIDLYLEAHQRLSPNGYSRSLAMVANNLGMNYGRLNQLDEAEKWYLKVIAIAENLQLPQGLLQGYNGAAAVYNEQKNFAKAMEYAQQSLQYARQFQHVPGQAIAYLNLGRTAFYQNKYQQALDNYRQAYAIFEAMQDATKMKSIAQQMAMIYEQLGNYQQALQYNKTYHSLKDSLFSRERTQLVEELQTQYETEKMRREKESAELDNLRLESLNKEEQAKARRNRNGLLVALSALVVLVLLGILYNRQQKLKKQTELTDLELKATQRQLAVEKQKREAELKAVRAQLNPHFIFNVLNSIQEFILLDEKDKAGKALTQVATMMRKTLKHSQEKAISLQAELELIQLFVAAEKLRMEDRLQFHIDLDEEVEPEFITIPPMLIQPYVENAIQHGIRHKADGGQVWVHARLNSDDLLEIAIEDNGVGRTQAAALKKDHANRHNSFSTQANAERIQHVAAATGQQASVTVIDKKDAQQRPRGTRVVLHWPLNWQPDSDLIPNLS